MAPSINGVHHVTFVVRDLDASVAWFESVLGAEHQPRFDHHDPDGVRFGVIVQLAGFPGMVELRMAADDYPVPVGYDPVTFQVADDAELEIWLERFEQRGVEHSPIKRRRTGQSIEFFTPDRVVLRLFTAPAGGFDEVSFQEEHVDH